MAIGALLPAKKGTFDENKTGIWNKISHGWLENEQPTDGLVSCFGISAVHFYYDRMARIALFSHA